MGAITTSGASNPTPISRSGSTTHAGTNGGVVDHGRTISSIVPRLIAALSRPLPTDREGLSQYTKEEHELSAGSVFALLRDASVDSDIMGAYSAVAQGRLVAAQAKPEQITWLSRERKRLGSFLASGAVETLLAQRRATGVLNADEGLVPSAISNGLRREGLVDAQSGGPADLSVEEIQRLNQLLKVREVEYREALREQRESAQAIESQLKLENHGLQGENHRLREALARSQTALQKALAEAAEKADAISPKTAKESPRAPKLSSARRTKSFDWESALPEALADIRSFLSERGVRAQSLVQAFKKRVLKSEEPAPQSLQELRVALMKDAPAPKVVDPEGQTRRRANSRTNVA